MPLHSRPALALFTTVALSMVALALPASASAAWKVTYSSGYAIITGQVVFDQGTEVGAGINSPNGGTCKARPNKSGAGVVCRTLRSKYHAGHKVKVTGDYANGGAFRKKFSSPGLIIKGTHKGRPTASFVTSPPAVTSHEVVLVRWKTSGADSMQCRYDGKVVSCPFTLASLGHPTDVNDPNRPAKTEHSFSVTAITAGKPSTTITTTWTFDPGDTTDATPAPDF